MRAFHFPLQNVLDHRERIEELKKKEFALAQQRVSLAEQKLFEIRNEFEHIQVSEGNQRRSGEGIDEMILYQQYKNGLQLKIKDQEFLIKKFQAEAGIKRKALLKAKQDHQAIINLKEKKMQQHKLGVSRETQKFLDDIGQKHFWREKFSREDG